MPLQTFSVFLEKKRCLIFGSLLYLATGQVLAHQDEGCVVLGMYIQTRVVLKYAPFVADRQAGSKRRCGRYPCIRTTEPKSWGPDTQDEGMDTILWLTEYLTTLARYRLST
ncbi:hypothetical protein VFPPC_07036 [Pochonia chlamydosporia 170]|uniref:Uncharacterized protein n=1 Tax=Pochonia chlamydosporia 170 TaxID=1380566 RepID=A0A179FA55_METCM|nr:hypothetical protein VFPPC_07036 [Pochonia chlamydosporia 170]OAQ62326.1 hypothetical protein VFPPC_07036 [Pochonia chlamydosporia 170]